MLFNLSLKYNINGKDYGKAFNIKKGDKYRAAVYLYRVGDSVKLIG